MNANAKNPEQFAVDVRLMVEAAEGKLLQAVQVGAQDLFDEVIANSPVDTGHFRNSYYPLLNGVGEEPAQEEGAATAAGAVAVAVAIADMQIGDMLTIVNSAPYGLRLEYGFTGEDSLGRQYDQPGRGFIRAAMNEAPRIFLEAAQRVGKGEMGGVDPGGFGGSSAGRVAE